MMIDADWLRDPDAQTVCAMLTEAGHQAWFVGGCVRNALLGAPVADLDLCTDAHPETVVALAGAKGLRIVPTGIDHGTVTVIAGGKPFEVTTFRRDVATDGRRAVVAFADDMETDARRRDFTMNALYAAPDGALADPLRGLPDLQARRVRFIDDAGQRIREDYLRILRFFRFHAWYGDSDAGIDAEGLAACADHIEGIAQLSRERIGHEMRKLLAAPDPAPALAAMAACGALAQVMPGASAALLAVLVHVEQAAGLSPDWLRRLAMLGGETDRLRLTNAEGRQLEILQADAGQTPAVLGYLYGVETALSILAIRAAIAGRTMLKTDPMQAQYGAAQVFPLTAADLMPALQGPALGEALNDAEQKWIASGFALTRADLLDGA